MATLKSFEPFDMSGLDLNQMYVGAMDYGLADDVDLTHGTRTYRDLYYVEWTDGATTFGSGFGGDALSADSLGRVTGGTVTGYFELIWDGVDYQPGLMLEGISMSATAIRRAAETADTDDDFALLAQWLAGNDSLDLSLGDDLASGLGGDDTLTGRGGDDLLLGGIGQDSIMGGAGRDSLTGEAGNDLLIGQSGSDVLLLDAGNDRLDGGSGRDTVSVWGSAGASINLSRNDQQNTGYGMDAFAGIEDVSGDRGHDRLTGSELANLLNGNAGDDQLNGRAGADSLIGGGGGDLLLGGANHDQLTGGSGADTLDGGLGRDLMHAGVDAQADVFLFTTPTSSLPGRTRDRIEAFDSGEDILDLRQIDANSAADGNQQFRFSSDGPAAHAAWLVESGANLLLRADVNGDQRADFEIAMLAVDDLVMRDMLL